MIRVLITLPLLGSLSSCGSETAAAAKETASLIGEQASELASGMAEDWKAIDWSALDPDRLRESGGALMAWLVATLGEIRDSRTAEQVVAYVTPILDAAGDSLVALGEELPDRAELRSITDELRARFAEDEGVMRHLAPLLERLSSLLG